MTEMHRGVRAGVRVALVEQYAMVAETFMLAVRPICTPIPVLVGPQSSGDEIAGAVLAVRADVAVLHLHDTVPDHELPVEQLAAAGVTAVVLADHADDARFGHFIERGAEAALSTEMGLRRLVGVISRVRAQEAPMAPDELTRLRDAARERGPRSVAAANGLRRLSVREGEILRYLMAGLAPAEIARRDFVAEATVRTQVRSVLAKLGVSSQLAAVAVAYRSGWRPQSDTVLKSLSPAG